MNELPVQDNVSNIGRSRLGSEMIYQEREDALIGRDLHDEKSRNATEEQYLARDEAAQSYDMGLENKDGSASEFFKHEEAFRGDITSGDRSVAATQQNYFANVEHAELGRADSFNKIRSDTPQDYMNKSELAGRSNYGRPGGIVTPNADITGRMDYLNKSEAEFGMNSTVHEGRSQTKFFTQEDPAYGKSDHFVRNREEEEEYNPTPLEDSSGRSSESTEGGIANH